MNRLKQGALELYRLATTPARRALAARMAREGRAPIGVLFYHRVADSTPNDWTMGTRTFERQVDWLTRHTDVISLEEAQRRIRQRDSHRVASVITFDDGYADNCEFAIPLLLRRNLPFTYFVSTDHLRDGIPFPHDVEAGEPLRCNSISEIKAMADAGVEIGAHTRTHADLGRSTDPDWLDEEIGGSVEDIKEWTGREVRSFAFPYGLPANTSPEAFAAVRRSGIETVCTAYGAYNLPGSDQDPFHIRRVHADPQWARFINWMTIDPRKVRQTDPIDDSVALAGAESACVADEAEGASA